MNRNIQKHDFEPSPGREQKIRLRINVGRKKEKDLLEVIELMSA